MTDDTLSPFAFPTVQRKKVTAAFDGGRLTPDGGVVLLAAAERRLGLADKLAAVIADGRDPARVVHTLPDMPRRYGTCRATRYAVPRSCHGGRHRCHTSYDPPR